MSLNELWTASNSEFSPLVTKYLQLPLAFILLAFGVILTGSVALSRSIIGCAACTSAAAIAFGFGVVYLSRATGTYI
ncbi:hypothetical protein AAP_01401 [Ascosphaera apis ARSEF 7405]|uniref:Dolichyl-diphosphooligosaccharide-protein glycosyltransferase subunit OST5 n=1 Tax=Ascosphaera apis ARSEF 7405 TaxID=392613 RepID=A0A168BTL4_9EURO|nr:hypothetical protein AAP_01401 [Ascosphaera apis ARSEF 7405]